MQWFPVDKQFRNDWKTKAVKRRFGVSGVGQLVELWSYIASEGSQTDEGRGVRRDGAPLDLNGMADDCDFPTVDDLRSFLDYLADIGHIDPVEWRERGIVFLPAMNRRLEAYRQSKGRGALPGQIKRGRGRPRRPPIETQENTGNNPGIISGLTGAFDPESNTNKQENQAGTDEMSKQNGQPEKSGETRVIPGNTGETLCSITLPSGSDLLGETRSPDQKTPKVPSPKNLIDLWNELRTPGPKVLELTDQRRQRYRLALKAKPDLDDWRKAIEYLNGAKWANAPGSGHNPDWRADLDYLAKPGNVTKALERIAALALPGAATGNLGRVAPTPGRFANAANQRDEGSST